MSSATISTRPRAHHRKVARAAAALVLACAATAAHAAWPEKTIRIIVPGAPGAGPDASTRVIAPLLAESLGQQIVVENRPGASGNLGAELASRAAPDGYTLLTVLATLASNPALMKQVPYDLERSFAPISQTVSAPLVLVGHPSLPARNLKELIALARARPGQIEYASPGTGTISHLAMELFLGMTGTKMLHVPYKGGAQAMSDVIGGHVSLIMLNTLNSLPHLRSGRMRGYGVTGTSRVQAVSELPTIAESGLPGFLAVQWYGFVAPAKTPPEVIARLHGVVTQALKTPALRKHFSADGADAAPSASPEEFAKFVSAEIAKWGKVVRAAGIKPE